VNEELPIKSIAFLVGNCAESFCLNERISFQNGGHCCANKLETKKKEKRRKKYFFINKI
jgi:hypothetical protein